MPSNVSRSIIRTAIRNRGDWPSTSYPTDTEINTEINNSIAEFYDVLTLQDPSRYRSTANIAITAGTSEYTISSSASDFYRMMGVEVADTSAPSGYWTLEAFQWGERNDVPAGTSTKQGTMYEVRGGKLRLIPTPAWSGTVRINYIPTAPTVDTDGAEIDTVNKWSDWIIWDVVSKLAIKENDTELFQMSEARKQKAEARIIGASEVDHGRVRQVTDAYARGTSRRYRMMYPDG